MTGWCGLLRHFAGMARPTVAAMTMVLMERAMTMCRSGVADPVVTRNDAAIRPIARMCRSSARTARVVPLPMDHPAARLVPLAVLATGRNCRSSHDVPMSRAACWQSRARSSCCMAICTMTTFVHGSRGWLAIDPQGLIGERTYEVANLLGNPMAAWRDRAPDRPDAASLEAVRITARSRSKARSRLRTCACRAVGELVAGRRRSIRSYRA